MLILFGVACVGVLVEALAPRRSATPSSSPWRCSRSWPRSSWWSSSTTTHVVTIGGAVAVDGPTLFLQGALLVLGAVSLLLIGDRVDRPRRPVRLARPPSRSARQKDLQQAGGQPGATEVYPLTMFALGGMLLFVAANDLLTMFVALEVFSLPLYLLCALARRRRLLSQEAALKYFLLGSYASAFFLFGVALIYGFAGGVQLGQPCTPRWPTRSTARCCCTPASR